VLDVLERLVDKSLVQVDETATGDVRYWLLDTIRQFGRDRLAEQGEADDTQARHLAWIRDFCETAEPSLQRGDLATLARVDDQLDDIRVALAWACSASERAPVAVDIVGTLGMYWLLRGRFREGLDWCRAALAADAAGPNDAARLRARWALVNAEFYAGDIEDATVAEADAIATEAATAGLAVFEARCRGLVGIALGFTEPATATAVLDEAVALADQTGDEFTMIDNRHNRGFVNLFAGNLASSAADFDAARPLAERLGNGLHLGFDGSARALLALAQSDPPSAVAAASAGQTAARRTGDSNSDAAVTFTLCFALADRGSPAEALEEVSVSEEFYSRRPGWLTEISLTAARAYVLSSVENDEAAAEAARRCLETGAKAGIPFISMYGGLVLAAVERRRRDFASAAASLGTVDEVIAKGLRFFVPDVALERARLYRAAGQPDRAEECAHAALAAAVEMGFGRVMVLALEELAHLGAAAGAAADAARLIAACGAARQRRCLVPTSEERRWIDETTAAIATVLGDDAVDAFQKGEGLTLDDAVAYARRARGERGRPAAGWGSLTPTERQVVDLVVEGFANPQIADRLLMSRSTVKAHLAHVYRKLAVGNRAELAAVAARHSGPAADEKVGT
jgi:DNA-binding CsgD family transcriptional regulator